MSLEIAHMNASRATAERIPEGTYAARLISIIDLGTQPQTDWQTGDPTDPKARVLFTWELPTETIESNNEDTGEVEHKARRISKEYTLSNFEQSNLMKLIKALSAGEPITSLTQMLGFPCMVSIGSTINGKAKITTVMKAPTGMQIDECSYEPTYFDFDNPDQDLFVSQAGWIQQKIREAINYTGFADTWGVEQ